MAETIVRVKRRLKDDPVEALLISYKRKKTEGENVDDAQQALLAFAATVDQNDNATATKAVKGSKAQRKNLAHIIDVSGKSRRRNKTQADSAAARFKVLGCMRGLEATIVDVDASVDTGIEEISAEPPRYVYDLYAFDRMDDGPDVDDAYWESLVSVHPFTTEWEYRGSEDSEEADPYEEDSNEENHRGNDYPDSDHSINDDDMRLAVSLRGMGIDDGQDLSSDSEDERYLRLTGLTGESPPKGFAAYKARVLRENLDDSDSESGDSSSFYVREGEDEDYD